MSSTQKSCLHCNKGINGRADKKFCNDYCRSSYHNGLNGNHTNYIRQVNYQLQKNRRILAAAYSRYSKGSTVPFQELLLRGFSLLHFTHQQKPDRSGTYICCYDYGYRMVGRNAVKIVQYPTIDQLSGTEC
ncbi:MAG: hypothetical protein I8H66_02735 [Sphingobacteriia bacterium]|nr:hypothetical protein [Sphingobacteriia bacterium]